MDTTTEPETWTERHKKQKARKTALRDYRGVEFKVGQNLVAAGTVGNGNAMLYFTEVFEVNQERGTITIEDERGRRKWIYPNGLEVKRTRVLVL